MLTEAFFGWWGYWDLYCLVLLFLCFVFVFFIRGLWNIAMISMNLKKLTVFQFIFTNCLHSLVPNCPDNGHLSLVETGCSLAYQSFLVSPPASGGCWSFLASLSTTQGDSQETKEHSLSTCKVSLDHGRDSLLLCGPPEDPPREAKWQRGVCTKHKFVFWLSSK